jgi:hypothetical protein
LVVDCRVPYLALAVTLEKIEGVSGRLKIIEILANYFRSVIMLSPEDLLPSVYLCLNKLGPAYEGIFLTFISLFVCLMMPYVIAQFVWPFLIYHFWHTQKSACLCLCTVLWKSMLIRI